MAEVDLKVMDMVEKALEKDPGVGSSDLFERVKKKHPGVADLSVRQFHARYPLQVKRRKAAAGSGSAKKTGGRRPAAKKRAAAESAPRAARKTRGRNKAAPAAAPVGGRTSRDAVRAIILDFATELASADAKADVVKVLAGADQYVDQVISALDS